VIVLGVQPHAQHVPCTCMSLQCIASVFRVIKAHAVLSEAQILANGHVAFGLQAASYNAHLGAFSSSTSAVSLPSPYSCTAIPHQGARLYSHESKSTHREPTALSFDEDPRYDGSADFDQVRPRVLARQPSSHQHAPLQPGKHPNQHKSRQRHPSILDAVRQTASKHWQQAPENQSPVSRPDHDHLGRRFHDYRGTIKRLYDSRTIQFSLERVQEVLSQPGTPHYSVISAAFTAASRLPYTNGLGIPKYKDRSWYQLMEALDQLLGLGAAELDARGCASVLYACGKMKHKLPLELLDALCAR
jgi:hypothetical protein